MVLQSQMWPRARPGLCTKCLNTHPNSDTHPPFQRGDPTPPHPGPLATGSTHSQAFFSSHLHSLQGEAPSPARESSSSELHTPPFREWRSFPSKISSCSTREKANSPTHLIQRRRGRGKGFIFKMEGKNILRTLAAIIQIPTPQAKGRRACKAPRCVHGGQQAHLRLEPAAPPCPPTLFSERSL